MLLIADLCVWALSIPFENNILHPKYSRMRVICCILVILGIVVSFHTNAQLLTTDELISAWKAGDTSQTIKAEVTYNDIKKNIRPSVLEERINDLHAYLDGHPNSRLEVRVVMYEVLGKNELHAQLFNDTLKIKHAMKVAGLIGDRQLLSELYSLYAEHYSSNLEDGLFYELNAIEMQRTIGFSHFPLAYKRFLIVSTALYSTMNYMQCIRYGQQCLMLLQSPRKNLGDFILQTDAIGASYRELGMADSSIFYYKKIQEIVVDYVPHKKDYQYYSNNDTTYVKIWKGVAEGGIAQGLFLQKKYDEAYPLLLQNIQSSVETKQFGDAALAQNTLAAINFIRKQYDSALSRWKQAYQWASQSSELQNNIYALQNIADVYKLLGNYDSAYFYNDRYHIYKDTLQWQIDNSRLATINARIGYDNMQASLQEAQNMAATQKRLRNYILAAVALLAIFSGLLYNRYRLKQNLRQARLQKEKQAADREAEQARRQIADAQRQLGIFTKNISEKNQLIESLQSKLNSDASFVAHTALSNFTILTEDDWLQFKESFEKVYPGFWRRLSQKMPELTTGEQRFMALSRLGMNNKEMAAATGVSPQSIRVTIFRLRKKINLPETDEIRTIAQNI